MPQYTFTEEESIVKEIQEIAKSERRSFSEMVSILIRRQLKERNRKKKNLTK